MSRQTFVKRSLDTVGIYRDLTTLQVGILGKVPIADLCGFFLDIGEIELRAFGAHLDLRISPDRLAVAVRAGSQIGKQGQRACAADVHIDIFRVASASLHLLGDELLFAVDQHAELHTAHLVVAVDSVDADPRLEALCIETGQIVNDLGGGVGGDALVVGDLGAILIDADLVTIQVGVLGKGSIADFCGGFL